MYLTESERKRIKSLHEASSASGAGSYETPMGFKAERPEIVGELPDETDMGISDDEGVVMDVDELMGMLGLSEEDDKKRMRRLHKDGSIVVEQKIPEIPEIPEVCLSCVTKVMGALSKKYEGKAKTVASKITEIIADGEITVTEFGTAIGAVLYELGTIGYSDIIPLGKGLWGCKEDCM